MLGILESHGAALTALFTCVIAFASVVQLIVAWSLARDNRLLRKAGTEPEVVAYLLPRHDGVINLIIANIGRGPAKDIDFRVIGDKADFETHEVQLVDTARPPITLLPQDDRISTAFGIGSTLGGDPALKPFSIEITFSDMNGKLRKWKQQIDVRQYEFLRTFGEPAQDKIARSIDNIEKEMKNWHHLRLRVETMTAEEARQQTEAVLAQHGQRAHGADN